MRRDERFIHWDTWSLERVWHFMRGTYPWVDHFDRPDALRGRSYAVGGMSYGEPGGLPGTLVSADGKFFVAHAEGHIRVFFK